MPVKMIQLPCVFKYLVYYLSIYDVTWIFEYLLHEPDIELLKEIMPQRQQNEMLHNDEQHKISVPPPQKKYCAAWFKSAHIIFGLWNHVRNLENICLKWVLKNDAIQTNRKDTELLSNPHFSICGFLRVEVLIAGLQDPWKIY